MAIRIILISVDRRSIYFLHVVFSSNVVVAESRETETSFIINIYCLAVVILKIDFTLIFSTLRVVKVAFFGSLTMHRKSLLGITEYCLCLVRDIFVVVVGLAITFH